MITKYYMNRVSDIIPAMKIIKEHIPFSQHSTKNFVETTK
jgi:hypothetical protein